MTPRKAAAVKTPATKLFVLDTNVLMHDPTSLFRFEEHDVYLPMFVLEELDNGKKGMSEVARNARQASRFLDSIVSETAHDIDKGIPLQEQGTKSASGRLFLQTQFITKDYFNDKVLEDTDLLYTGVLALPGDFWETHGKDMKSGIQGGQTFYDIKGPMCRDLLVNQFVYHENGDEKPLYAVVTSQEGNSAMLRTLTDYTHQKNAVWGITARNREQNFVLNLLMNPEIDFITLLGQAGTGKTLLTLAAGLMQTLEHKLYSEIIMTRVTVPVGEDIGFLPGTEEEKMTPWMGALDDNLDVLNKSDDEGGEWGRAATRDLIRSRIKVKSLNFMRGRTFINKYLIIDEAQNLTPKQMKTLITRAGPGTKVVCMGNIAQIDTPYLTEGSSGLTYVVDRFKGWEHSGHITLQRGERSRLADHAGEVL